MNKVIHKYLLGHVSTDISVQGAKFLSVQVQRNRLTVWIETDLDGDLEHYKIRGVPTGEKATEGQYIGTALLDAGDFVLHMYAELVG